METAILRTIIYVCTIISFYPSILALDLGSIPKQASSFTTPYDGTRRGFFVGSTMASLMYTSTMIPTVMAEEPTSPQVTAIVSLDLSIARGPSSPLQIELFGDAAPESVEFFASLASGTLQAKCTDDRNIEACKEYESINVGYKGSQLWRLVPNKRIDFGRVDSMFSSRVPPTFAVEGKKGAGDLKASRRGAVSVKRGGGAFEFTVTPSYNPALDKEDLVVVGQIAEGESMSFLDAINSIPTRRDVVAIGDVPPLGSNFARVCDFTSPDPTCVQFKPLKRIIVTGASFTSKR